MKTCPIFCFCVFLAACSRENETKPEPVVEVKAAQTEVADLDVTVHAPAAVFPRQQANIASRVTSPIRELRARKGDSVSAGQILAVLENRDVRAQQQEALAALEDATAQLQKISTGTLPTDIERARGQLATAEAALNQARKIYDRRAELFKLGAIPARDLLVSQTELANANANYEVARRSLELLETQSREKDIRIAESRVAQARARLAQVEALLQFTELRAPFAGTITEQLLYPGDMAKPETSLFTVMDLAVAVARAQVPEAEAREIRLKQRCDFMPADSKDRKFGGKVSLVNKAVDPARRTVEVWCDLQNPDRWLRAGVFGAVDIVTGTAPKSILVPQSAVQFVEGTRSGAVLVVDGKRVAHKREVETGMISQGKVQIRSGLRAGELVVVEGGYGLPDGTEVRILETDK
ncbi:MAG: hypothetical protein DMG08_09135 [Acidobacteria bacterium]|nr:MAG: hypothetical protein DMG08_09135 [Acidobacteriota bacterium]